MKATVSEKGQVTIPKRLRDRLGIRPGEVIDFEEDSGRLVGRKAGAHDTVADAYGSLSLPVGVDEFVTRLRGPAPTR